MREVYEGFQLKILQFCSFFVVLCVAVTFCCCSERRFPTASCDLGNHQLRLGSSLQGSPSQKFAAFSWLCRWRPCSATVPTVATVLPVDCTEVWRDLQLNILHFGSFLLGLLLRGMLWRWSHRRFPTARRNLRGVHRGSSPKLYTFAFLQLLLVVIRKGFTRASPCKLCNFPVLRVSALCSWRPHADTDRLHSPLTTHVLSSPRSMGYSKHAFSDPCFEESPHTVSKPHSRVV